MQYLLPQYFQSVTLNFTTRAPHLTQKASAVVTFVLSRAFGRHRAVAIPAHRILLAGAKPVPAA
jgi:hypothetical protein